MSEQKESSVLFSLKELMNLEEDRIKTEEAEKQAADQAAEAARLKAEQEAREAEEARIRAEEERRMQEEQRAREEAARLDAIKHAEVEKARLESEQKARMEAMAAQQHQERALATIQSDEHKKKLRNWLIGGGIAAVLLIGIIGGVGYTNYQDKLEADRIAAQKEKEFEEKLAKLQGELKAGQDKIAGLASDLEGAKDEATRVRLQKELEAAKAAQEKKQGQLKSFGAGKPAGGDAPAKKACNCDPNDPLCDCF